MAKLKKRIKNVRGRLQDVRAAAKADGVKTSAEQAKIDRLKERLGDLRDRKSTGNFIGKPGDISNMEDAALGAVQAGAQNFNKGEGFNPYTGQRVADFAPETEEAMAGVTQIARDQANGGLGTSSADLVQRLLSGNVNANALQNNVGGIASGQKGLNTESDLRTLLANSGNPAFQSVIDTQAGKLTDDITRAIGQNDGAIGSAYHTGTITDQVGDLRNKMASDNWNQNIRNQSGILGQIGGVQGANIGNQLGAATALSGEQFGNIGNQMQGVGLTGQANQNLYNPYQMLGTVGAAKEGQQTAQIQAAMNAFNESDMQGVNRLNNYANMISGAGQLAPAAPQAVTNANPFGGALAGAIQGASLFPANPVLGALGGGILGGGSQLFA